MTRTLPISRAIAVVADAVRRVAPPARAVAAFVLVVACAASAAPGAEPAGGEVEARFERAVALAGAGRTAEAAEIFAEIARQHPELPEPLNNLAALRAAEGRREEAVDLLRRALQTSASYHTAYENLTRLYARMAGEAYGEALADAALPDEQIDLVLLADLGPAAPAAVPLAAPSPAPAASPTAGTPAAAAEPAARPAGDPVAAVRDWASAWSEQRVADYLAFYSRRFEPPGGASRAEWASQRRTRLTSPSYIRIGVDLEEILSLAEDRVSIRFRQSYDSNTYSDVVTKTLEMVWEDGNWKIVAERVEP